MLRDIRELTGSQAAYAEELRRRWGGLLSYRYLGRRYASMDAGPVDDTVTLRHDMRNATGGILLAVLGIASPEGGGMNDLEAVPNPVVHACQVLDPGHDVRRIEVRSEVLRRGRRMSYSRSRVVDADQPERVLATTEGQGVSIGTPPEGLQKMEVDPIEVVDSPDLPPLWQVLGGRRRDDGHYALGELVASLASPDAALHLGPQFAVMERAACDLAADAAGTDRLQGVSSHVMFLARGKVGPFRVDGEAARGTVGTVGVRVLVHDEGNDERAITSASYLFRAAPMASPPTIP
jgi:acyl-coenzyme A thioesterase PaaI-like protein